MAWLDLNELAEEFDQLRAMVADHEGGEHADEEWGDPEDCPKCDPVGEAAERLGALDALDQEIDLPETARNEGSAIPEDEFEDYAEQLAEDIGAIDREARWPLNRIDWEAAAEDLKVDYTEFDFDGTTYLVRAY